MSAVIWFFRKWFWVVLAWFKDFANKPLTIPMPAPGGFAPITPVPLAQAIPALPMHNILVCSPEQIPADERSASKTIFYRFQVWLYTAFSPMQAGLPSIDRDPDIALRDAYTWLHRLRFAQPTLPAEYLGSPDLGALAVRGPYVGYTRKCADGSFEWDLQAMGRFEHHAGLIRLGAHVRFELDRSQRALRAVRIDSALGRCTPQDSGWETAKRLALCTATTHTSLVRHFNWVHLAASAPLAIATRNKLPTRHALFRLLWPYIYATAQSNDTVTRGQMLPGGDFETTFSHTFEGQCQLFDSSYGECDFGVYDPQRDAHRRGVLQQGFDTPTEDNLAELFGLMHTFTRAYVALYYPHAADNPAGNVGLRSDPALVAWLDALNRLVPHGVGVSSADVDFDQLARLLAQCIYLVSVQHELLGSYVWNYQPWTHRQPVRMYANGQPEPLDVYQRLINANYNLNVHRRALIGDFGYLALDERGAAAMRHFSQQLQGLQSSMEQRPWAVWKLYPSVLKVNINA